MKKSKFSESQIVNILKEAEAGVSLADLISISTNKQRTNFIYTRRVSVLEYGHTT
jgi:hypothetical protein